MPRFLEIAGAVLGLFVLASVAAWGYWFYTPTIKPVPALDGDLLAYRLALELPDRIAAVAPVAASLPDDSNFDCKKSGKPVAILILNGTADPMNPYEGGEVALYGLFGSRGTVMSTDATVAYFA